MSSRNKTFKSREPFSENDDLQLQEDKTTGPFGFFNPTNAQYKHTALSEKPVVIGDSPSEDGKTDQDGAVANTPASDVSFMWRSRDNRKGRHTLVVTDPKPGEEPKFLTPEPTRTWRHVLKTVVKMFTYFPFWNISWLVAFVFTCGSAVWVINGYFSWFPIAYPNLTFPNESKYGGGITAFIGAVIFFETGSFLLMFEAFNEHHDGCFGFAVEGLFERDEEKGGQVEIKPHLGRCSHHHRNKKNLVGKHDAKTHPDAVSANGPRRDSDYNWVWFPSKQALKTHYFHEIGFIAGFSQFCGASVFSIAGITALPGVLNNLTQTQLDWAFWFPQIVGSIGFIISGTLYMVETQKAWYIPNPSVLGWWIGFWNLIGALGFELCGCLGPAFGNSGAQYQSALATWWGSWAFLIGSLLQLYESLSPFSVEKSSDNKS